MTERKPKPERHFIVIRESIAESIIIDGTTFLMFAAMIGLGVYLESEAMQWIGGMFFIFGMAARLSGGPKKMTKQQALDYINKLEV